MRDALKKTGRPIFYSLCNWGSDNTPVWAPAVGNSWRTTGDINPTWYQVQANFFKNQKDRFASGIGGWNDPDMLEVGVGDMLSLEEQKTHFALWAIVKAPLLLGLDLNTASDDVLAIIKNTDLIGINQDPDVVQAYCALGCDNEKGVQMYTTKKAGTEEAYAVITNFGDAAAKNYTFKVSDTDILPASGTTVSIYDMFEHKEVFRGADAHALLNYTITELPSHASAAYRIRVESTELTFLQA